MRNSKYSVTVVLLVAAYFIYAGCTNPPAYADKRGVAYAGSAACMNCHKEIVTSYTHNMHYRSSWDAGDTTALPPVGQGNFVYENGVRVALQKRDKTLFQVAYKDAAEINAQPLQTVFGAGSKAMTFTYWTGKEMYQLPLSWFRDAHGWANSPGFSLHKENFNRMIIARCFECHSSYVARLVPDNQGLVNRKESFDRSSIIYGIDCERCHGPAASHVKFQAENPTEKTAKYITQWKTLSRQQKTDACGVCHSGNDLETQRSTFAFVPGDTLSKFFYPSFGGSNGEPDVHGKQVQMLMSSKCYISSTQLECGSCHTTHTSATTQTFVSKCNSCHASPKHTSAFIKTLPVETVSNGCINCHMPEQASHTIDYSVGSAAGKAQYFLRTHRIAVYPNETQAFVTQLKHKQSK